MLFDLPQAELFVRQIERPGLHSQAVAWPPRLSAGRRESGSQRPWLGHQAPLSIEFSRQEYWGGLPFPSPGDLPDLGIEPMSLVFPTLDSLPLSLQGSHAPLFLLSLVKWDREDFPVAETLGSQCRDPGLIPGQGTRPHMPQLRVWMLQQRLKIPQPQLRLGTVK